jgi:hypothetical protein
MNVITSTYRHRGWNLGFRCILEFPGSGWETKNLCSHWRIALREQLGEGTAGDRPWVFEYYRGGRRIYLRDPSVISMMILINPELAGTS